MRHYLLTRSAYAPDVSIEENRYRLSLLEGVTVPSIRAQTERRVTWIVMVHKHDPLLKERRAVLEKAGLSLVTRHAEKMILRNENRDKPYGPWAKYVDWSESVLTTRIDDDDAFAPWALAKLRAEAERWRGGRSVLILPSGWISFGGLIEPVTWRIPPFTSCLAPLGDRTTIMDVNHTGADKLAPLRNVAREGAWLYVRHSATRSSYDKFTFLNRPKPQVLITDEVRSLFPVDWDLIERLDRNTMSPR